MMSLPGNRTKQNTEIGSPGLTVERRPQQVHGQPGCFAGCLERAHWPGVWKHSRCRGVDLHLTRCWNRRIPQSADMDLGAPMEFQKGSHASSCVERRKPAFLSSCKSSLRRPDNFPDIFLGPRAHPQLFLPHSMLGQPCIESCLREVPGHKLHVIPAPG